MIDRDKFSRWLLIRECFRINCESIIMDKIRFSIEWEISKKFLNISDMTVHML